jgi:uncharacterized Ntn-hydrolase superfamily protein
MWGRSKQGDEEMNADAHLEDTRMPKEYPEETDGDDYDDLKIYILTKQIGVNIKQLASYQEVAKMLADELKMALAAKAAICWEEPDENSSALIAYKALVGEK